MCSVYFRRLSGARQLRRCESCPRGSKWNKIMLIEREAIRAIILAPENEVLLMRIHPPDSNARFWWITPGGGLEPGEPAEAGLKRELREELGLEDFELGPLVWLRQHTFNWGGKRIRQSERYYVVHADRFEPAMSD